ncbi:MAG: TIGR02757 family protein [Bacteroidales bacterium]|jgi:uncharacterized protein (TIGR02757 family)|nr:TIGR02757 family protein [Bacteroidales bacterium]
MTVKLNDIELKEYLENKYDKFANLLFIENDPISIPHTFLRKEDIEISGFIAATIAWGKRKMIINNGKRFMDLMDNSPYDFVINHKDSDLKKFNSVVHRTFSGERDMSFFIKSLKNIYQNHGGLEGILCLSDNVYDNLVSFYETFFSLPCNPNTRRHIANVASGSAGKRMNMFLRWMVRDDRRGVDFGLWKNISPSDLYIPLDVHSGRIARLLGLLTRKQDDWKAVVELTNKLKEFDDQDPVKYDFALFGVGVNEDF